MRGLLRIIIVGFGLPVLLLLPGSTSEAIADEDSRPKAPEFAARDLKGKIHKLSELLEEGPVFIDFWTTWCKPCKLELPELDRLHRTYREKGFRVVAISQDDQKTVRKVKPYIQSRKYEMLVLVDPKRQIGTAYSVRGIYPTSFLINMKGEIVHFASGYSPGDEIQLEVAIRELLGLSKELPEPSETP